MSATTRSLSHPRKRTRAAWPATLAALAACLLGARALGAISPDLFALSYLIVALYAAMGTSRAAASGVVVAISLEILSQLTLFASPDWGSFASRSLLFTLSGAASHAVLGVEMLARRRRHKLEVDEARENILIEARSFRLNHSGRALDAAEARAQSEQLILTDAVEAVHHSTYVALGLLKRSLGCHTCVLLWMEPSGDALRIRELVSDCDAITEGDIDPARGAVGGVVRRREVVHLSDLRAGYRGLPYYSEAVGAKHFLGVPLLEQGHLRGVLCVDRTDDRGFEAGDVDVIEEAGAYILRAIQNERLFTSVERSKYALSRFFDASRRLNAVLTPADVFEEAMRSVAELTPFDVAVISTYDPDLDSHTIQLVEIADDLKLDTSKLQGAAFGSNAGLVSMAIKNQHYLPYGGHVRGETPVVFTRDLGIGKMRSLLVLPLCVGEGVVGAITVGHREPHRYGSDRREMLEVVGNQVAITLQNANLYAQMEHMATRDGLTGLTNRREFMSRLEEASARHRRNGRTFSLLLTDIDHFKSVNDTYGHPVGDEVLRRVSAAFRETLRECDLPARYGGEEFIVLLEETEIEGAVVIADRLREAIAALVFQSEQGPFQCTISMGVAQWPGDAEELKELIDASDQALYASKKNGRNRVTRWSDV